MGLIDIIEYGHRNGSLVGEGLSLNQRSMERILEVACTCDFVNV